MAKSSARSGSHTWWPSRQLRLRRRLRRRLLLLLELDLVFSWDVVETVYFIEDGRFTPHSGRPLHDRDHMWRPWRAFEQNNHTETFLYDYSGTR